MPSPSILATPTKATPSPRRTPSLSFSIPIAAPIAVPVPFIPSPPHVPSYPSPHSTPHPTPPSHPPPPPPPPRPSLLHSPAYTEFKANVPLTRVPLSPSTSWSYYALGPSSLPPLIFLSGAHTTPSSFYSQLLSLSARGYRVIAAAWPPYWTVAEWVAGFRAFLDALRIPCAHVFGFGLGGMLALQFAVDAAERVASLVLCCAMGDTTAFAASAVWTASLYWMPQLLVQGVALQAFPAQTMHPEAVDFIVQEMAGMPAGDIASRLTLLHTQHAVDRLHLIDQAHVTLISPAEEVHLLPEAVRDRLHASLPDAKVAWLKGGGDWPFLSTPDEVTMHIILHLRRVGQQPQALEDVAKAVAAEGVRAVPSSSASHPPGGSVVPSPAPVRLSAPLFRPARSVIDGGPAAVMGYDAGEETIGEEKEEKEDGESTTVEALLPPAADGAAEQAAVDAEVERRRVESVRLQEEVEARLYPNRAHERAEREKEQQLARQRSAAVIATLVDGVHAESRAQRPASSLFEQ